MKKPITSSAMSELVQDKLAKPTDFNLDDKIEEYSNLPAITSHRNNASRIIMLFKCNRCNIVAKSDTHTPTKHPKKPISEGILRAIFQKLDRRHQLLMLLGGYTGHRYETYSLPPIGQIELTTDSDLAILRVQFFQNKTRIEHDTLAPKPLILEIIAQAKVLNLTCLFPNYVQMWKHITHVAGKQFGVHLTSHYLRARFQTIASHTPMDVNDWDYLQGSKKSKGHEANRYSLTYLQEKIIPDYKHFLIQKLAIDSDHTDADLFKPAQDPEKEELKRQLQQLTKLNELLMAQLQSKAVQL